jgi:membrane protein
MNRALLVHYFTIAYQAAVVLIRRAQEEDLGQVAASLTFTTMLAIVPLLTIGFAILTYPPVFEHMQTNLHDLMLRNLMPESVSNIVFEYLDRFSEKARNLTLIGLGFLTITAVSMMLTIDTALNTIWRVHKPRPLYRRILIYWAILMFGPLLISLSLSLSAYLTSASAGLLHKLPLGLGLLIQVVPVALLALGYAALYVYIPNRPVRWKDALIGGVLAAFAFDLAKYGFAIYIARFPTYTTIYGPLAALPLFLLWVYLSWYITLMGAVIAASLPSLAHRKNTAKMTPLPDRK